MRMRFLLLLSGILLLGAACSSPEATETISTQIPTNETQAATADLFSDDKTLFFDEIISEPVVSTTILTTPTTTPPTTTSPITAVNPEQKKKIVSNGHSIIIPPKQEPPPLPPKTVVTKKISTPVEVEEETEAEEEYEGEVYEDEYEEEVTYEETSDAACEPDWDCTDWSICTSEGKRTYSCVDTNGCKEEYVGTESCKPPSKLTRGPYTVAITGTNAECKNNTVKAINLLKTLPSFYQFFITYVGEINCIPQASRMDVYKDPPRFQVGYKTAGDGDVWYASVLVHEACHSQQYRDYVYKHNSFDVPQELFFGYNAEYQCNQMQKKALIALGAEQYLIDSMDDMSSEWWKLSEEEQTW